MKDTSAVHTDKQSRRQKAGALDGIRVLDLTDERGIYGVKLLADLGACVVRPEPPEGDRLRERGPHLSIAASERVSLWHAYFASNRRFLTIDVEQSAGLERLQALIASAHIVMCTRDAFAMQHAQLEAALLADPSLVVVDVSSFGDSGPWRDFIAPDLVAGALGGAVATTGDADTQPLKSFGELNFMVSGTYAAIAALSALHRVQTGGPGQRASVSVHSCIASCLEHVLMWRWYEPLLAAAQSQVLPRRGSLHWSNAYKVMNAASGSIMVTPAPDFEKQIFWLVEEDAHEDLIDPKYLEPENFRAMVARLMEVLHGWVAGKDAETLFFDAQERHAPYGWVLPIEKLVENPQLQARDWWADYRIGRNSDRRLKGPGAPYHLSATPWQADGVDSPQDTSDSVLSSLGWLQGRAPNSPKPAPDAAGARRPLEGIRVLDFTHVLAGPFATRVLADMGADVVKVSSLERVQGTNDPTHPYYVMWNRNKRALALNMKDPQTLPIARKLAEQADVVIDNFSVGVLDRWGLGYESVSAVNAGVIYTQMSGMGEGGPWSKFVTYAPTIHALCGLTQLTGVPGREDIGVGFSYNDHQAGLHGAVAILAALAARERTGKGQRVDLSQFETGVNFLGPSIFDWYANNTAARPSANDLPYDEVAPHGVYPCLVGSVAGEKWSQPASDAGITTEQERWVAIACMSDDQWLALRKLMGDPDWSTDASFATGAGRYAARTQIDSELRRWTSQQTADAVMNLCQHAGVPAGVVQTGVDLIDRDPQLAASGFAQTIDDPVPGFGQTFADRLPIDFSHTPCDQFMRVRSVGEDNHSVLADWLSMTAEEITAAEQDGRLT